MAQAACGGHGQKTGTKTKEWSLKGEVLETVHGERAVNVELDDGRTCLFERKEGVQERHHQDILGGGGGGAPEPGGRDGFGGKGRRAVGGVDAGEKAEAKTDHEDGAKEESQAGQEEGDDGREGTVDDPKACPTTWRRSSGAG